MQETILFDFDVELDYVDLYLTKSNQTEKLFEILPLCRIPEPRALFSLENWQVWRASTGVLRPS